MMTWLDRAFDALQVIRNAGAAPKRIVIGLDQLQDLLDVAPADLDLTEGGYPPTLYLVPLKVDPAHQGDPKIELHTVSDPAPKQPAEGK